MKQITPDDVTGAITVEQAPHVPAGPETPPIRMVDRGLPRWAWYLSVLFSITGAACIAGLAVVAILFQRFVAQQGDIFGVIPFLAVGLVPVAGLYVIDYAQARAFAGIEDLQSKARRLSSALAGGIVVLVLGLIHPLLMVPPIVALGGSTLCMSLATRLGRWSPNWDFTPAEAVSVFTGRDDEGFACAARQPVAPAALRALQHVAPALACVLSVAMGSWMVATSVLILPALIAVVGLSVWASYAISRLVLDKFVQGALADPEQRPAMVTSMQLPAELDDPAGVEGLIVHGLTVTAADHNRMLSDVQFTVAPGQILGIMGPTAAGKSTLAQALIDPFSIAGASVCGVVRLRDVNLWDRSLRGQTVHAAMISSEPKVLPYSGRENLMAFQSDSFAERARRCLESLLFSAEAVDRVLAAPDATRLSGADKRALELARMFFLAPTLMVLDRPETYANPAIMRALAARLVQEKRAGRSIVLITEDRSLLDVCDSLMVLQNGRIVDHGPADEITTRASNGWSRFVCDRRLEAEDVLANWMQAHFKRKGDEGNRENLSRMGSELLAFSCQDVAPLSNDQIAFDFKHYKGHCVIKLTDQGKLLTSAQIQKAQRASRQAPGTTLSPLGAVMKGAQSFEQAIEGGKRVMTIKVTTYDPRLKDGAETDEPTTQEAQN